MYYRFIRTQAGGVIIEFAIILPILIILMAGVLDFGLYYLRAQTANRAVANISHALTINPNDPSLIQLKDQQGLGLVALKDKGEGAEAFLCVMSYATQELADTSQCEGEAWDTAPPDPAISEYYIAIRARSAERSVTGLFSELIPPIDVSNIIKITNVTSTQGGGGSHEMSSATNVVTYTNQDITEIRNSVTSTHNQVRQDITSIENRIEHIESAVSAGGPSLIEKQWIDWPTRGNHGPEGIFPSAPAPDEFCQSKGFKFATGECRVTPERAGNIYTGVLFTSPWFDKPATLCQFWQPGNRCGQEEGGAVCTNWSYNAAAPVTVACVK